MRPRSYSLPQLHCKFCAGQARPSKLGLTRSCHPCTQKAVEVVHAAELRVAAMMEQLEASKAIALDVLGTKDEAQQELDVLACMVAKFTASQSRKAEHVSAIEKQLADAEVLAQVLRPWQSSMHLHMHVGSRVSGVVDTPGATPYIACCASTSCICCSSGLHCSMASLQSWWR